MSKDAKPDTWMPLVIGDYLKDTTRLTTEQHGAYLLLIMAYWVEGPPPDDDDELASITRLGVREWRKHRPKLVRFFRVEEGHWRHKRIDAELERWSERKAKYAARASAGGRAKAASSSNSAAKSTPQAVLKGCLKAAPQPASREVDAHRGQSTLSGRDRPVEQPDGSPGLHADDLWDTEGDWAKDATRADVEELRCRRSDPDQASELAEFASYARARAAELRRQRLSVVAA